MTDDDGLVSPGGLIPPAAGGLMVPLDLSAIFPIVTADRGRIAYDPNRKPLPPPSLLVRLRNRWRARIRNVGWRIATAARVLITGSTGEEEWYD